MTTNQKPAAEKPSPAILAARARALAAARGMSAGKPVLPKKTAKKEANWPTGRINLVVTPEQRKVLAKHPGAIVAHARKAMEQYINRLR